MHLIRGDPRRNYSAKLALPISTTYTNRNIVHLMRMR